MSERISSSQLVYLMTSFILGSSLVLSSAMIGIDRWAALLLGLGEGLAVARMYTSLAARFPGQTFVSICREVYGSILGKVVALALTLFSFQLGSLVLRNFADYFNITQLSQTPQIAIMITLMVACAYGVKKGPEVIARTSQVFLPATIILIVLSFVLLLPEFSIRNFKPLLDTPIPRLLVDAHGYAAFPFAEIVVFLMVFPLVNKGRQIHASVVSSMLIAGMVLLVATVRNIGVLGDSIERFTYPTDQALRLINIARILTRLEILAAVNFITMGFVKISVCLYASTLGLSELLGARDYRCLVSPVALVMTGVAYSAFTDIAQNIEFAQLAWPIYAPVFQVIIPAATLALAALRMRKRRVLR